MEILEITVSYSRQQISWFVAFLESLLKQIVFRKNAAVCSMHSIDQCGFATAL